MKHCLTALVLMLLLNTAQAQDRVALSIGSHESSRKSLEILELGVEFGFQIPRLESLEVILGIHLTGTGTRVTGFGFRYWAELGNLGFSTSTSLVYYDFVEGRGKDLGLPFEFMTSAEFTISLGNIYLGLGFRHLSNASISETNPGLNTFYVVFGLTRKQE